MAGAGHAEILASIWPGTCSDHGFNANTSRNFVVQAVSTDVLHCSLDELQNSKTKKHRVENGYEDNKNYADEPAYDTGVCLLEQSAGANGESDKLY